MIADRNWDTDDVGAFLRAQNGPAEERCYRCDALTGRAGKGEDSLYIGDHGPYCSECYNELGGDDEEVQP